jgi:hypothetical protein
VLFGVIAGESDNRELVHFPVLRFRRPFVPGATEKQAATLPNEPESFVGGAGVDECLGF